MSSPASFERIVLPELGSQRMYGFHGWDHCVARQILPLLLSHGCLEMTDENHIMDWQQQTNASVHWLTSHSHSAYIDTAVAWYEQPAGVPDMSSIQVHAYDQVAAFHANILKSYVRKSAEQKLAQWSLGAHQIA